jgi:hypothetical protein
VLRILDFFRKLLTDPAAFFNQLITPRPLRERRDFAAIVRQ